MHLSNVLNDSIQTMSILITKMKIMIEKEDFEYIYSVRIINR
ncbi:hypothetical protein BIFGAL_03031 [Bifidobacterium gallicum DSM 20093 = LMG 11596]|uniref:Uncharacterized protein n=1 Tax=Bifidobacterium gallicum DSM 20093 = LMG 11596 TaxID=561180 RepID=D1NRT2_9BIFI|nr:hypothetical protein BIFGAL_03031 [Bifidobacterium gallicum DSM 20093 = LMG 11596]KFI59102.1 hypothetical protein BGLCM_0687 [Bifidobacterium gallicum DSM 20093 = LMG 11596]